MISLHTHAPRLTSSTGPVWWYWQCPLEPASSEERVVLVFASTYNAGEFDPHKQTDLTAAVRGGTGGAEGLTRFLDLCSAV
jgi:hypothetical protein